MPRFNFNLGPLLTFGLVPAVGLIGFAGCASNQHLAVHSAQPTAVALAAPSKMSLVVEQPTTAGSADFTRPIVAVQPVVEEVVKAQHAVTAPQQGSVATAPGRVDSGASLQAQGDSFTNVAFVADDPASADSSSAGSIAGLPANTIDLNLPSALAMVGGQHPAVGFARWRVQEAYAQLAAAEALWLPSIQAGFSGRRHDGNYQAVDGDIVDVNLNSFQYGLGAGAVGAGTTTRPGVVAQFHMADAIFQPKVAERAVWARGHAAAAVLNERLLNAATAYIELVNAYQDARILEESRDRTAELSKITADFAEVGEGLQADADRMQTELMLTDNRLIESRERIAVASARLAQAISLDANSQILPLDITAVPLDLVAAEADKGSLISTGLSRRPELKESQALVAAACEAYKRERYAPFVPSVLLGFSTGGFGGGLGNNLNNVEGRYDLDALVTWQYRNLGLGEQAARRETTARIQQAKFEQLRVMDQVALDVSESLSQVQFRRQQIEATQKAIKSAEKSYQRNVERIRDGQGLPIEVLQSVQALESARRAYLNAVISYNQAQFRLQWALGWPASAPSTINLGM